MPSRSRGGRGDRDRKSVAAVSKLRAADFTRWKARQQRRLRELKRQRERAALELKRQKEEEDQLVAEAELGHQDAKNAVVSVEEELELARAELAVQQQLHREVNRAMAAERAASAPALTESEAAVRAAERKRDQLQQAVMSELVEQETRAMELEQQLKTLSTALRNMKRRRRQLGGALSEEEAAAERKELDALRQSTERVAADRTPLLVAVDEAAERVDGHVARVLAVTDRMAPVDKELEHTLKQLHQLRERCPLEVALVLRSFAATQHCLSLGASHAALEEHFAHVSNRLRRLQDAVAVAESREAGCVAAFQSRAKEVSDDRQLRARQLARAKAYATQAYDVMRARQSELEALLHLFDHILGRRAWKPSPAEIADAAAAAAAAEDAVQAEEAKAAEAESDSTAQHDAAARLRLRQQQHTALLRRHHCMLALREPAVTPVASEREQLLRELGQTKHRLKEILEAMPILRRCLSSDDLPDFSMLKEGCGEELRAAVMTARATAELRSLLSAEEERAEAGWRREQARERARRVAEAEASKQLAAQVDAQLKVVRAAEEQLLAAKSEELAAVKEAADLAAADERFLHAAYEQQEREAQGGEERAAQLAREYGAAIAQEMLREELAERMAERLEIGAAVSRSATQALLHIVKLRKALEEEHAELPVVLKEAVDSRQLLEEVRSRLEAADSELARTSDELREREAELRSAEGGRQEKMQLQAKELAAVEERLALLTDDHRKLVQARKEEAEDDEAILSALGERQLAAQAVLDRVATAHEKLKKASEEKLTSLGKQNAELKIQRNYWKKRVTELQRRLRESKGTLRMGPREALEMAHRLQAKTQSRLSQLQAEHDDLHAYYTAALARREEEERRISAAHDVGAKEEQAAAAAAAASSSSSSSSSAAVDDGGGGGGGSGSGSSSGSDDDAVESGGVDDMAADSPSAALSSSASTLPYVAALRKLRGKPVPQWEESPADLQLAYATVRLLTAGCTVWKEAQRGPSPVRRLMNLSHDYSRLELRQQGRRVAESFIKLAHIQAVKLPRRDGSFTKLPGCGVSLRVHLKAGGFTQLYVAEAEDLPLRWLAALRLMVYVYSSRGLRTLLFLMRRVDDEALDGRSR